VATPVPHEPVLPVETLELLAPRAGSTVVDATLGAGGHAEAILQVLGSGGHLLGIDRDAGALGLARDRLARFGPAFTPLQGDHRQLAELLHAADISAVDGILFDLGVSSMQLDDPARGFSFRHDGPLDMRMNPTCGRTAADVLRTAPEEELRRILWTFGEEKRSAAVARALVAAREREPISTTGALARVVEEALGPAARRYRIHPATRTFQALRIVVNDEVEYVERLIAEAVALLRRGGRLVVIAYHSLEDRAVKRGLKALAGRCTCPPRLPVCGCGRQDLIRVLTSRPLRPSVDEIDRNPRARSAKLRAAERL